MIVLKNGDRVTGEILELEYGLLRLSTDDMGTINIEWAAIAQIDSQYTFDVERAGGRRYAGVIATSEYGQNLVIRDEGTEESVPKSSIVRVTELEQGFWQRISGSLSVGFNYTKATGIRTASINISSQYQAERLKVTLDISALETSSPDREPSARENIFSTLQFQRERPSFLLLLNSLERNDELGIDARLTSGGGIARYFGQDQDSEIMLLSGIVANQEWTRRRGREPAKSRGRARRELAHISFQQAGNQSERDGLSLSEPHGIGATPRHSGCQPEARDHQRSVLRYLVLRQL